MSASMNVICLNDLLLGNSFVDIAGILYNRRSVKESKESFDGKCYEKCWNVLIKLGCAKQFPNNVYTHYYGNINRRLKKVVSLDDYFKDNKIPSNDRGPSDITMKNKQGKYITFSSKYYKNDSRKQISHYDIERLIKGVFYSNRVICLLVKDKQKVKHIFSHAQSTNHELKNAVNEDNIFDEHDFDEQLPFLQAKLKEYFNLQQKSLDSFFGSKKPALCLRFHQKLFVSKIMANIQQKRTTNARYLLGAKPRSGKTYCVGGLLLQYYKKYGHVNALIITPAPNETISQFKDDLFHSYQDFEDWNIHRMKYNTRHCIDSTKNNVILVSKQFIDDYIKEGAIHSLKNLSLDFIISDENHFHGTTSRFDDIIHTYTSITTIHLYLTATYQKPLMKWNIPENCRFYWDINDEMLCKNGNVDALVERHGEIVRKHIRADKDLKVYKKMPELHILTTFMHDDQYNDILKNIQNTSYGFSIQSLFALNKKGTGFADEANVSHYLEHIIKRNIIPSSVFDRIPKIASQHGSRTLFKADAFTSQLWFLPYGQDKQIDKVSECFKKFLEKHLKNWAFVIVNSKQTKDPKLDIQRAEQNATKNGKAGLIILAGGQLTLGVTLPYVDVVVLLNHSTSSDRIIQMMYRCMSEKIEDSTPLNSGDKKIGFVVDCNPFRLFTTLSQIGNNQQKNPEEHLHYLVSNHLVNIDADKFDTDEKQTNLINKMLDLWKANPVHTIEFILSNITPVALSSTDQQKINKSFLLKDIRTSSSKNIVVNQQPLPTGQQRHLIDEHPNESTPDISFTQDILPSVLPLVCFLCMKKDFPADFVFLLTHIKNNPTLLTIFQEQTNIWWNQPQCIDIILNIVQKYFQENNLWEPIKHIQMTLESLIDKPIQLLEYIHSLLKPKQTEKKLYGEVFTPMPLINEMLDKLPADVWTNPHLKWFDPAAGMGNFPIAVYLRLMEGLEQSIPDPQARKKHILENMLYMSELNSKNVHLCKQIFDVNDEYRLNLYCGNTLELDVEREFGVEKFDIVLGNPPYQKGNGNKGRGNTLWDVFTKKALNHWLPNNGYLVFIHPCGWRQLDHPTGKLLLEKQILYLNMNDVKAGEKMFGCSTTYDWYVLRKSPPRIETTIRDYNNQTYKTSLKDVRFIPNHSLKEVYQLLDEGNSCGFICDQSSYEPRKTWMSTTKCTKYKYPCIYTINVKNDITLRFSSINKGHFGICKFIISNGCGFLEDRHGEYGLTQWAYGIPCHPNDFKDIHYVLYEHNKFREILQAIQVTKEKYNYRILRLFKKDFWKDFIDESNAPERKTNSTFKTKSFNITQLKQMCKERKIKGFSKWKKHELAQRLLAYHGEHALTPEEQASLQAILT